MAERLAYLATQAQAEVEPKPQEPTLRESLGKKKIPLMQRRAVGVLESMTLSLADKRALFFYFLWQETGSFVPIKEYTEIKEDPQRVFIDPILNNDVMVNMYDEFYFRYEAIVEVKKPAKKTTLTEKIVSLIESGVTHEEIGQILGIRKEKIDDISKTLIAKGMVPQSPLGRHNALGFSEFVELVEKEDRPNISDKEIAGKLKVSETKVKRARRRLRLQGRIKKRTASDVAQGQKKSRELVPLREKIKMYDMEQGKFYTAREIAKLTGATFQQVKHQRSIIRRDSR